MSTNNMWPGSDRPSETGHKRTPVLTWLALADCSLPIPPLLGMQSDDGLHSEYRPISGESNVRLQQIDPEPDWVMCNLARGSVDYCLAATAQRNCYSSITALTMAPCSAWNSLKPSFLQVCCMGWLSTVMVAVTRSNFSARATSSNWLSSSVPMPRPWK